MPVPDVKNGSSIDVFPNSIASQLARFPTRSLPNSIASQLDRFPTRSLPNSEQKMLRNDGTEMNFSTTILLTNAVSTLFLVGLIWMVQIVHYPLFDQIGEQTFAIYQQQHQSRISFIVGPTMLIELITAILLIWYPISGVSKSLVFVGVGLVAVIWLSTAFLQVPCHEKLVKAFDPATHQWLVNSNWIRTIAWTARGVLLTYMLVCILSKQTVS